jgi:hypothetical protein
MDLLDQIIAEQPQFHRGETEIKRAFADNESYLNRRVKNRFLRGERACYGVDKDVAKFLYDSVNENSLTLEIGSGISTFAFALKRSNHIAITPNADEITAIRDYAIKKSINLDKINFVIEESNNYLPKCDHVNLDLVFIDGKHAFPWPIIDWFYTADRSKKGGFMIVDDAQIYAVSILKDFMKEDPRWRLQKSFGGKTFVFQKLEDKVHDVAWHMQPYTVKRIDKMVVAKAFLQKLKPDQNKKFK